MQEEFFGAAKEDDLSRVKEILDTGRVNVNQVDNTDDDRMPVKMGTFLSFDYKANPNAETAWKAYSETI